MAQRIITVNVGPAITLVAETEYKTAKPKVFKSFYMPTPEGFLTDGVVTSDEVIVDSFAKEFKSRLSGNRIGSKKVVFVADSKRMASREESLPKLSDNKLRSLIETNASDYFPVAMDAYQVTYKIIEEPKKEDTSVRVQLYAIPQNVISSYEKLAEALGLNLLTVDCRANSVIQSTKTLAKEETIATLDINSNEVVFTVVSAGALQMQRSIAYGIGDLYDMVSENAIEAIDKLHVENVFDNEETIADVDDTLMMMTGSIKRMLEFYKSKFFETELNEIYLTGLGDGIRGMAEYLSERVGAEIKHSGGFTDSVEADSTERANSIAVGGAIDPLELQIGDKAVKGKGLEGAFAENDNFGAAILIFVLLLLLAVATTVVPFVQYQMSVRYGLSLDNTIASLQPAKTVYLEYLDTSIEYEDLKSIETMTDTPANRLLDFLQELEAKMPRSATVDALSAGTESVDIDFIAPDKDTAAQILIQLRSFDTVLNAETISVNETTSDEGITEVRFTVNCIYKPQTTEE